jgi:hypothetical protein
MTISQFSIVHIPVGSLPVTSMDWRLNVVLRELIADGPSEIRTELSGPTTGL